MLKLIRSALAPLIVLLVSAAASAQQPPAPPAGSTALDQAVRQQTQPGNNAPVWRDVRSEKEHTTTATGPEAGVLVQSGGETWRAWRNHYVVRYGGWALSAMVVVIALFHWRKGTMQLHGAPTGRKIQRFKNHERLLHWSTAISFVVLALSGLILLFGKYVLLPILGPTLFALLAQLGKNLHNFIGPVFLVCAVMLFITFVKNNFPRREDWVWVRKFGGLFSGEHVSSDRFNAGEKAWFWIGLTGLGIVVGISGLVLDFPNFMQTRATMQFYHLVHVIGALIFMIAFLGHVYMGTIGVAGAYQAMRTGYVDEQWMKEHHDLLYNDIKAGKVPAATAPGGASTPSAPQVQH